MTRIAALASTLPLGEAPGEIVFLPEGVHSITPWVDGKPKRITVRILPEQGPALAAKLQADLESRQAENVRPIFDFEHRNGKASAIPTGFRYEPGAGILVAVDWTKSGRDAIEGRDFSYFSPEFLIDEESGEPTGLPSRGPLGGLVNDPAFREIPRIAAANADATPETDSNHPMKTALVLASIGLLSEQEAALEGAETLARSRVAAMRGESDELADLKAKLEGLTKERDELKGKLADFAKADKEAKAKRADDAVKAAVAAGRIAPKDEATQGFWRDSIAEADGAKADAAVSALNALPATFDTANLSDPTVKAGAADRKPAGTFEAQAEALVAAKQAPSLAAAYERVAAEQPELYEAYCERLHAKG